MKVELRRAAVLATLLVSAAACGKKDADDAAPADAGFTTSSVPSTPAPSAAALTVTDVRLGKAVDANRRVADDTDDFDPNDTIYASVVTSGTSPGATLHARWTFENGQLVDSTSQSIAPSGDAATEFHIAKPGGFPKGKYKLSVMLNGAEVRTKDFKVD
jgi:predicted small lipoprotein YifL